MNKKIVLALSLLFAVANVTVLAAQDAAQVTTTTTAPSEKTLAVNVGDIQSGKTTNVEVSVKSFWHKYRIYILIAALVALGLVFLQTRRER
jgi:hypothetical protein